MHGTESLPSFETPCCARLLMMRSTNKKPGSNFSGRAQITSFNFVTTKSAAAGQVKMSAPDQDG
jgi:hypothetical protein